MPAESVKKSPGFFDLSAFINLGIAVYLRYLAAFCRNFSCSSWCNPGNILVSVPMLVLIGGATEKSILLSYIN